MLSGRHPLDRVATVGSPHLQTCLIGVDSRKVASLPPPFFKDRRALEGFCVCMCVILVKGVGSHHPAVEEFGSRGLGLIFRRGKLEEPSLFGLNPTSTQSKIPFS